jgi:CBS domain-containing protein
VLREYIVDPFETMRVSEIMARPVETRPVAMPVADAVTFFTADDAASRHKSYPVVDAEGKLAGIISRSDVLRWTMEGWPAGQLLSDTVAEQELAVGYDDELVGRLADRMAAADASRVPILRRSDRALVGLVARRDLLRVRLQGRRHETEREALIAVRRGGPKSQPLKDPAA